MNKIIPRIAVSMELCGITNEDFNLDIVTNSLKLKPTYTQKWNKAPQICIDRGDAKTFWHFELTEENCREVSIPFMKLRNLLIGKEETINELCEKLKLEIVFGVYIYADDHRHVLIHIPKIIMSFLVSLNANLLFFDQYYYNDSNSSKS